MAEAHMIIPEGSPHRAQRQDAVVMAPLRRSEQSEQVRQMIAELRERPEVRLHVIDPATRRDARGVGRLLAMARVVRLALRRVRSADLVLWQPARQ